jgi:hypothetical protein
MSEAGLVQTMMYMKLTAMQNNKNKKQYTMKGEMEEFKQKIEQKFSDAVFVCFPFNQKAEAYATGLALSKKKMKGEIEEFKQTSEQEISDPRLRVFSLQSEGVGRELYMSWHLVTKQ